MLINIILGIFFAVYFIFGRSKLRGPTKLNMKANEDFKKSIIPKYPDGYRPAKIEFNKNNTEPKMTVLEPETQKEKDNVIDLKGHQATKNLNIYFMFNMHEWEAHEALGVPAAAPLPVVTAAYQKLVLTCDPAGFEFYELAYQAILKRWRDRL
ncbi:MAG: hypothetical protein WA160_12420 [Pseudobdellovibrio sp.]